MMKFPKSSPLLCAPSPSTRPASLYRYRWPFLGVLVLLLLVIAAVQVYWMRIMVTFMFDPDEKCVKLGRAHLENKFVRTGTCFSRKRVQQILIEMVKTTSVVFTSYNITHWLDSGTFLGAYRHQSIIPYDQDADMGINYEGYLYIRDHKIHFPSEYHLQVWNSSLHPQETRFEGLPVRIVHKESALYVDVFAYKNSSTHYWYHEPMIGPVPSGCYIGCDMCPEIIVNGKKKGWELLLPRHWIFPLRKCLFAGSYLLCPNRPHEYFLHMFGKDYMLPVKYEY